ncbi:Ankyrin repeats (3 copies) [Mucilaginibacter gotjawali]|nr:Ankyrin repeats (3 copies) [Mucilaginibacter gotjawali]
MISGFIGLAFTLFSCTSRDTIVDKTNMNGYDFKLFQGTQSWTLAKAVEDEDTGKIVSIVTKNKELLESREPKFGQTLLKMAVRTLKFKSVKTLINQGADPNIQDTYDGSSPFMEAARIDWIGPDKYGGDIRYLRLLLVHGGDPNAEEKGKRRKGNNTRYTPLLRACSSASGNLAYVKLLVEAGANVNYNNEYNMNPLGSAVFFAENPDIVLYLIEKGADIRRPVLKNIRGKDFLITDALRTWRFPLGSDEYKKKMQIVDYLKKNGMDYWKAPIPENYLDQYPKDYLEKY